MKRFALSLCLAGLLSAPAAADRLFTVQISEENRSSANVLVCIGTEEAPAAYGGAVTDEKGQVVLVYPSRGLDFEPISSLIIRAVDEDGAGTMIELANDAEENRDFRMPPLERGSGVTCGRRLPVPVSQVLPRRAQAIFEERGIATGQMTIIPSLFNERRRRAAIEAARAAEEEALAEQAEGDEDELEIMRRREYCFGAVGV